MNTESTGDSNVEKNVEEVEHGEVLDPRQELLIRRFLADEEFSMRSMVADYKKFIQVYMALIFAAATIFSVIGGVVIKEFLSTNTGYIKTHTENLTKQVDQTTRNLESRLRVLVSSEVVDFAVLSESKQILKDYAQTTADQYINEGEGRVAIERLTNRRIQSDEVADLIEFQVRAEAQVALAKMTRERYDLMVRTQVRDFFENASLSDLSEALDASIGNFEKATLEIGQLQAEILQLQQATVQLRAENARLKLAVSEMKNLNNKTFLVTGEDVFVGGGGRDGQGMTMNYATGECVPGNGYCPEY